MTGRELLAQLRWTLMIGIIIFAASAAAREVPPIMADSRGQTAVNLSTACMATKPRCALCSSKTRCKTCEDGFKLGACSFCMAGYGAACANGTAMVDCHLLNLTCTKCQGGTVSTGGRTKPPCTNCQDGFVPNSLQTKCIKAPAGSGGDAPPCNITAQTGCPVAHASCVLNTSSPVDGATMCACDEGYIGDAYTKCSPCKPACASFGGLCVADSAGKPVCVCDEANGFSGDGHTCTNKGIWCHAGACGPYSTCIVYSWMPDNITADDSYCKCDFGYEGDGVNCTEIVYTCNPPCGANADCLPSYTDPNSTYCACKNGFEGDPLVGCTEKHAFNCQADCSPDAICNDLPGGHTCACNYQLGFRGDGVNCTKSNSTRFEQSAFCEPHCGDNQHCQVVSDPTSATAQCKCDMYYSTINTMTGITCKYNSKCWPPCPFLSYCKTEDNGTHHCVCASFTVEAGDGTCSWGRCAAEPYPCARSAQCTALSADANGSYICECPPPLVGDGYNDCSMPHARDPCTTLNNRCDRNAVCHNVLGLNPDGSEDTYYCTCKDPFVGNGFECRNVTGPCTAGSGMCSPFADCSLSSYSFTCRCRTGMYGDGSNCTDWSGPPPPTETPNSDSGPCAPGRGLCSANATCFTQAGIGDGWHTSGTYQCSCNRTYVGDGHTCIKAEDWPGDPCANNTCLPGAKCTKKGPSYDCTCPEGTYGIGWIKCTPVPSGHPCSLSSYLCDPVNAHCSYLFVGFECSCNPGTGGDGYVCTPGATPPSPLDTNQCSPKDNRCSPNAHCFYGLGPTNTGATSCQCKSGYVGDGINCTKSLNGTHGPSGRRLQGWEQPAGYHGQFTGAAPWAVMGLSDGLGAEEGPGGAEEGPGRAWEGPGGEALAEDGAAEVGTASLGREGTRPHVARAHVEGGRTKVGDEE